VSSPSLAATSLLVLINRVTCEASVNRIVNGGLKAPLEDKKNGKIRGIWDLTCEASGYARGPRDGLCLSS
jgi:hypothetical protein